MRAISLWQPWASLLAHGHKRVETRSWPLNYRGPLLIHAAKKFTNELVLLTRTEPFASALASAGVALKANEATDRFGNPVPFGAIIGRVEVVGCTPTERVGHWQQKANDPDGINYLFDDLGILGPADGKPYLFVSETERAFGDYSPKRFAFVCKNPVVFEKPIFYRGALGLFDVPDNLLPKDMV